LFTRYFWKLWGLQFDAEYSGLPEGINETAALWSLK
jgi:hypothetical protein